MSAWAWGLNSFKLFSFAAAKHGSQLYPLLTASLWEELISLSEIWIGKSYGKEDLDSGRNHCQEPGRESLLESMRTWAWIPRTHVKARSGGPNIFNPSIEDVEIDGSLRLTGQLAYLKHKTPGWMGGTMSQNKVESDGGAYLTAASRQYMHAHTVVNTLTWACILMALSFMLFICVHVGMSVYKQMVYIVCEWVCMRVVNRSQPQVLFLSSFCLRQGLSLAHSSK